jgi:hypothetical protein
VVKGTPKKKKPTLEQLIKSGQVVTGRVFANRIARKRNRWSAAIEKLQELPPTLPRIDSDVSSS